MSDVRSRLLSRFPGVVVKAVDLDPELPGEAIEVFMVPDDLLAEFRAWGELVSIERVQAGGEPLVLIAHTVSWTKTHAPAMIVEGHSTGA
jgi:hypothetical protein